MSTALRQKLQEVTEQAESSDFEELNVILAKQELFFTALHDVHSKINHSNLLADEDVVSAGKLNNFQNENKKYGQNIC